jgi:hypothetical protein
MAVSFDAALGAAYSNRDGVGWIANFDPQNRCFSREGISKQRQHRWAAFALQQPGHEHCEHWNVPRELNDHWLRRSALLTVVAFALVTGLNYVVGANSGAMDFARRVVSESDAIRGRLGVVERVERRKFWGFRRKSGFSGTRVELYLRVFGSDGTVPLEMKLQQHGDTWTIVSSSVPL